MSDPVLRPQELGLFRRFPAIAWFDPQPVSVGHVTALTCRLCTALHGLAGADVLSGRATFASAGDHADHVTAEHTVEAEPTALTPASTRPGLSQPRLPSQESS